MRNKKATVCAFCAGKHFYKDHKCTAPSCTEGAPCHHTVLACTPFNSKGEHHSFDKACPTWKAKNPPRPAQGPAPMETSE